MCPHLLTGLPPCVSSPPLLRRIPVTSGHDPPMWRAEFYYYYLGNLRNAILVGELAQVIECLPSKCEALDPSTTKK
jgi:hypothetical protein